MFRAMEVPVLGVVENMSYLELEDGTRVDVFGQGGGEALAQQAGVPFIGGVPMDPNVRKAGDKGVPVVISHPETAVSKALIAVAEDLAAKISVKAKQEAQVVPLELVD
jgi:ATP-binding protein involved in chromosome partitioning